MYRYKDYWIANHKNNHTLNDNSIYNTCWELNMLWSEKVWFVNETINNQYFNTEFYGWCDIGYFRNGAQDIHTKNLLTWASPKKISKLDKSKIHYACICNDNNLLNYYITIVSNKNKMGLPVNPIPQNQQSVAGGFFILHKGKTDWWALEYTQKLELYFTHKYLVKDDQIIISDCIFSNLLNFKLYRENNPKFDNWFMFQRLLL
jgi:hypothetical protein